MTHVPPLLGLDDWLLRLSDGATVLLVLAAAVLLGLRHAVDPDHLAAVTTLVAASRERTARLAARLGAAWGLGHATSLFAFGLPIVLFRAFLPGPVQKAVETAIGCVIVVLAVCLLVRWRRGLFHVHAHEHAHGRHVHVHPYAGGSGHAHRHTVRARTPLQAYAIGLLHGMGGSAGVGLLLLATIEDRPLAVAALAIFAFFTAASMALLSTGFGLTLSLPPVHRSLDRLAPLLGTASLLFGLWYALGALELARYHL